LAIGKVAVSFLVVSVVVVSLNNYLYSIKLQASVTVVEYISNLFTSADEHSGLVEMIWERLDEVDDLFDDLDGGLVLFGVAELERENRNQNYTILFLATLLSAVLDMFDQLY